MPGGVDSRVRASEMGGGPGKSPGGRKDEMAVLVRIRSHHQRNTRGISDQTRGRVRKKEKMAPSCQKMTPWSRANDSQSGKGGGKGGFMPGGVGEQLKGECNTGGYRPQSGRGLPDEKKKFKP